MKTSLPLSAIIAAGLLAACKADPQETGDSAPDTGPGDTATPETCPDDANGEIPAEAEWITFDGQSVNLYAFSDEIMSDAYEGYYGTYDLNTLEVYGGNGFKLEGPGQVVGAEVRWTNLLEEETPATLYLWPDFSSDGYAFASWDPYGYYSRCLGPDDDKTWVTYAFEEPVEVDQPLHVFAGYHREEVPLDEDGQRLYTEPELLFENDFNEEDPLYSGIQWPDFDDEYYYQGMISAWYTWQVRLAVIYDDSLADEDKPFQLDEALSTSSRVAWGDYDNDGDDDVMTNGPTLYRNEGDGTFTDVTDTAIPEGTTYDSSGGAWGDYDNDGCLDYFGQGGSYTEGEVLLHANCDGTFTDVTAESGIDDTQTERDCDGDGLPEHSVTEGAGWVDYDGDGFLDLYLANYECSSEYDYYKNYDDFLFHNEGDGTFTDVREEMDIETSNQAGRGVTVADYDIDGDTDILVSNYRLDRNFFYENDGQGGLDQVAADNGTQGVLDEYGFGAYGHTIGSVFGDIDNDGDFDLVSANLAHPFYYHFSNRTQILVNDGSGNFIDEAGARGIYYRETHSNPTLFDADNDGDLDLFITCVYATRDSDFYENDGTGHFTLQNHESGLVQQNGWGSAAADPDQDGDVDLLAYDLFRNDTDNGHHWLEVQPVGVGTNVSAIGAVVRVDAGSTSQLRLVSGGSGTSNQDSFTLHFGLGEEETVDTVTVFFPYQEDPITVEGVDVDQKLWVMSDGTTATGFEPPDSDG